MWTLTSASSNALIISEFKRKTGSTDVTGGIADFLGTEMSDAVEFLE